MPLIHALGVRGQRWTRRALQDHEIDLGLLLWNLESSANPAAFGCRDCLIRLALTDQIEAKRFRWFRNEEGQCELCLTDPGGEIDLFVACTLPDMIHVIRGDRTIAAAIGSDRLELVGAQWARKRFAAWLNLSPPSRVSSVRDRL